MYFSNELRNVCGVSGCLSFGAYHTILWLPSHIKLPQEWKAAHRYQSTMLYNQDDDGKGGDDHHQIIMMQPKKRETNKNLMAPSPNTRCMPREPNNNDQEWMEEGGGKEKHSQ